jgi:hypothetical protein
MSASSYNAFTGELRLSGVASLSPSSSDALHQVVYQRASTPSTADRAIQVTVNDGIPIAISRRCIHVEIPPRRCQSRRADD